MGTITNFDAVKFQYQDVSPDKKKFKLLLINTLILTGFFTKHGVIRF